MHCGHNPRRTVLRSPMNAAVLSAGHFAITLQTLSKPGDHVQGLREPFSRPRFHPLIVR